MPKHNRKQNIPQRSKDNPLQSFTEWQDYQYDPGYWTGGRIPPFLLGKHPNKFGYVLLVGSFLLLSVFGCLVITVLNMGQFALPIDPLQAIVLAIITNPLQIIVLAIIVGLIVAGFASGISLLRQREPKKERVNDGSSNAW